MDDQTRLSLEDLGRMTARPGDNGEHERKRRQLVDRIFWTRSRKETFAAWLFILPDCIGLLLFVAIPMVLALSIGFFCVDGFGGYEFVGLANYNRMLRDPLFIKSLGVTIIYVLCLVPGLYVSGLGLALLVRQSIPLVGLWVNPSKNTSLQAALASSTLLSITKEEISAAARELLAFRA